MATRLQFSVYDRLILDTSFWFAYPMSSWRPRSYFFVCHCDVCKSSINAGDTLFYRERYSNGCLVDDEQICLTCYNLAFKVNP